MIKTYDEALKTLNAIRHYLYICGVDNCVQELDKVAKYFINEKHKENPTLEQCIKEWKEKECDFISWDTQERYEISNCDETIYFEIIKIKDKYKVDNHCCEFVEPHIIHLLSKTLKALENNNETK